ncbi:related to 37S ribosomal protein S7,mitochondrial [Zygosaccharomyces bailii ISA1307]|uniref:Small ribosomal subunit protein uS7m n=1 Tax=Zygosaccharomyces bailii (strain CLIB 213 / ATCC 58445 / CBS 680 / BCRC 21525 / NBRC 1098 / NCYC 1416 / NRRL Y-2227) TaxID=1333698 RepID=A0A8J2T8S5_ZYGB2|nr:ZYBA0S06-05028g1_1 [Zygosaccharomyces bailii CLIB 213]CDH16495.1 related to 37S ribosomal protein S7,mitochondrial [Zygosaccharomyces bailii ISA1307]
MLRLARNSLQTLARGSTSYHLAFARMVPPRRWENTNTSSLSDEKVEEWLEAIKSLKAEFSEQDFLPETSLAPPGQSRIDMIHEIASSETKFEPTAEQIAQMESLKDVPVPQRRDPVVEHVVNMIMRHGKKQRAEKILSRALYLVFCQTRQDPVELMKKSLDDLAPLMMVKTFNTGVAKAAVIPVPLNQKQRNRIAWKWIVEGANKRASCDFAVRLGEELVAVYKGKSTGFDKRDQMHKTAIAHRAYIKLK